MKEIYKEAASKSLDTVKYFISKYGPRVSGTKTNYAAVEELEKLLKEKSIPVSREQFDIHPQSLFSIGKIFSIVYIIGLSALLSNHRTLMTIGAACMLLGMVFCLSQFIFYSDLFDRCFRSVKGNNLVAHCDPEGIVKEQIVIVGHHDSSYVYPFHDKFPMFFPVRLFLPMAVYILESILLIVLSMSRIDHNNVLFMKYIFMGGLLFVVPMFWYVSRKGSPGAGDDLIGCTIGMNIIELFNNKMKLKNTRLILLLTDGEEVGQKGARKYVKDHYSCLKSIKTKIINIDGIYKKDDVAVLVRDRNGFSRLSEDLAEKIINTARVSGYQWKKKSMPIGGGGTDGGQFARRGIETTSIIGLSTRLLRKEILIHTENDMPDRIDVDSVGMVIEVVAEYIMDNDRNIGSEGSA